MWRLHFHTDAGEFKEREHPRGKGAKGGQFVKKGVGGGGKPAKPAVVAGRHAAASKVTPDLPHLEKTTERAWAAGGNAAATMAATGDVTGTLPHLAHALAGEIAQHAVGEHLTKLAAGGVRAGYQAVKSKLPALRALEPQEEAWRRWRGLSKDQAEAEPTAEDYALIEDFVDTLARVARTLDIPDDRVEELLGTEPESGHTSEQ